MNVCRNGVAGRLAVYCDGSLSFPAIEGNFDIVMPFAFPPLEDHFKGEKGVGIDKGFHAIFHGEEFRQKGIRNGRGYQPERGLVFDGGGVGNLHGRRSNRNAQPGNHVPIGFTGLKGVGLRMVSLPGVLCDNRCHIEKHAETNKQGRSSNSSHLFVAPSFMCRDFHEGNPYVRE